MDYVTATPRAVGKSAESKDVCLRDPIEVSVGHFTRPTTVDATSKGHPTRRLVETHTLLSERGTWMPLMWVRGCNNIKQASKAVLRLAVLSLCG